MRRGLCVVLLLAAAAAFFLGRDVLAISHYPFDIDEANHALGGLSMAGALEAGDPAGFVRAFYRQDFYPPGVAWLKGLAFWAFGATTSVARLFSVGSLAAALLVIYGIGVELDRRRGWLIGLVAVVLTLTMRPLLLTAGLAMLEAPGLLASMALLYAYLLVLKRPSRSRFLLVSLLLAGTFLTKYTYGVVGIATLALAELFALLEAPGTAGARVATAVRTRWLWLFGPFFLVLLVWFARPGQAVAFLGYTRPLDSAEPWLSLDNLLFYPRSLVLHNLPSPLILPVSLAALVWAAVQWRNPRVRLLGIYFLVGMASIMLVNHPPNPRFIVTFVPALHLLTAAFVAWLVGRLQAGGGQSKVYRLGLTAVIVLFVLSLPTAANRYRLYGSLIRAVVETSPGTAELARWIDDQVPPDAPVLLVNYWDQFGPPALAWERGANGSPLYAADFAVDGRLLVPATAVALAELEAQLTPGSYLVLLEGGPWGVPFWPDYTAALQDRLVEHSRERFTLQYTDVADWLEDSMVTPDAWEQARSDSRYRLDITAIVYEVR